MGSKRKWEVPSRHTVWEFDEDAPVGAEAEAILSEGGAEEIAGELLEAGAIVGGGPRGWRAGRSRRGGLARAARGQMPEVEPGDRKDAAPRAANPRFRSGPGGPLDGAGNRALPAPPRSSPAVSSGQPGTTVPRRPPVSPKPASPAHGQLMELGAAEGGLLVILALFGLVLYLVVADYGSPKPIVVFLVLGLAGLFFIVWLVKRKWAAA